ncbi:MAG: ABC transporter substrate-binding protein [Saprospiraceae bacterium]
MRSFTSTSIKVLLPALVLITSSCGWFKKAPKEDKVYEEKEKLDEIKGNRVFNPETQQYEEVKVVQGEMDTVQWKDADPAVYPPILSDSKPLGEVNEELGEVYKYFPTSEKKDRYTVGIILPFLGQHFDVTAPEIYSSSLWAVNFYGGINLALRQLEQEGVQLNIEVFDSKASSSTVENSILKNPDLRDFDLLIGPYRRDNIALVAEYAKANGISFVSPYSASTGLSPLNKEYIQVNPTFETHCEAITKHVLKQTKPGNVILVAKKNEADRFAIFQEARKEIMYQKDSTVFKELVVPESLTDFNEEDLKAFFELEGPISFVVPSWSDEIFVSNFLRVVDIARIMNDEKPVTIYGMPQWMDFSKVDYDYFEKLDLHVSSASYVNQNSAEVKVFKRNFFNKYNTVPSEEAFLGYDVMLYFGRMLKEYGTKFQPFLENENKSFLERDFHFEPIIEEGSTVEEPGRIEQFENKAIFILRYENYQFKPVPNWKN